MAIARSFSDPNHPRQQRFTLLPGMGMSLAGSPRIVKPWKTGHSLGLSAALPQIEARLGSLNPTTALLNPYFPEAGQNG